MKAQDKDGALYVSPSVNIITTKDDSPVEGTINIKNTYNFPISITLEGTLIEILESNISIKEDVSSLESALSIEEKSFVLQASQNRTIKYTLTSPQSFRDQIYPGIKVISKNNTNSTITIDSVLVSTIIIESESDTVAQDMKVTINKSVITDNKFKVSGSIENTGKRIFSPSGEIRISKNNKKIESVELTSQINRYLLPGQKIEFEKELTLGESKAFDLFGKYNIETVIKPSPFETYTSVSRSLWVVPLPIMIISLIIILVSTIIAVYAAYLYKLKKTASKKR